MFSFEGKLRKYDISVKRKHTKTNENMIFSDLFFFFIQWKFHVMYIYRYIKYILDIYKIYVYIYIYITKKTFLKHIKLGKTNVHIAPLILKSPKTIFFFLRKSQETFLFHFKSILEFEVLRYGFDVTYGWYNFFQLGLVSQSDKHCKLSGNDNKMDLGLFKINSFFKYWT